MKLGCGAVMVMMMAMTTSRLFGYGIRPMARGMTGGRGVHGIAGVARRQWGTPPRLTSGGRYSSYSSTVEATSLPNEAGEDGDGDVELIGIRVTQKKFDIDQDAARECIKRISKYLGVGDFQVDVWYCSEEKIREFNGDWRDKRKSTDVLSFPANEFIRPEVFDESDPTLQHMKHLGDIIVAPAYIHRQTERDWKYFEKYGSYNDDNDAGVSKAMAREFGLDRRIDLLLVHSMLHLVGYDHETDKDWKEMTKKEEEVMLALKM